MNNRSIPMIPFGDIQSKSSLLQGCELLMQMRFGAIADEVDFRPELGETLSYLYNPGDRNECPIYFPQSRRWCIQAGKVWLRFSEQEKIVVEFEDDLTPAICICFHHPEEIIEFIEFLEVATHENLVLEGKKESKVEKWFVSFAKTIPAKIDLDAKHLDPVRALRLYFRPGRSTLTPIAMLKENLESLDQPFVCAERNPEASLLATFDLLRSPEGEELLGSIDLGPNTFRKRSTDFFSNREMGLTLFLQSRDSIALRATRYHLDNLN